MSDEELIELKLDDLIRVLTGPLSIFVERGLGVTTKFWVNEENENLPLSFSSHQEREFGNQLLDHILALPPDESGAFDIVGWFGEAERSGQLPVGHYRSGAIRALEEKVRDIEALFRKEGFDADPPLRTIAIDVPFYFGGRLAGHVLGEVPGVLIAGSEVSCEIHDVTKRYGGERPWNQERLQVRLHALLAMGMPVARGACLYLNEKPTQKNGWAKCGIVELAPTVDRRLATERIELLARLYVEAQRNPYPMFGNTWSLLDVDRNEARAKFVEFCRNDGEHDRYSESPEYRVYGAVPDFDEIFPEGGVVATFFGSLKSFGSLSGPKEKRIHS
jgi:exonuclease V gamma subunit